MRIGIGASIYSGNRYDAAISSANLAARFDAALGITSSGGFASAWADQSGNGRSLLQATGANQPIHLAYSGTKYGWLPGVSANYFSATPANLPGDAAWIIDCTLLDWTPTTEVALYSDFFSAGNRSWAITVVGTGAIRFYQSLDGTASSGGVSSLPALTDGTLNYIAVTRVSSSGLVSFFKSPDRINWTAIGTLTLASGALYSGGTRTLEVGAFAAGSVMTGYMFRAATYSGIPALLGGAGSNTPVRDFTPAAWSTGATFVGGAGETYTINSTGSKPCQIVNRSSLLFDGAAHFMKCAAFTLSQPETVYLVAKQVTWTSNDYIFDGETNDSMVLFQTGGTPTVALYSGQTAAPNSGMTVGSNHVVAAVFNGASSLLQVDTGSAVTGDPLTRSAGGFTLGRYSAGPYYSNIQVYEGLIYSAAHDAATRSNIIRALMSKHGVA